MVILPVPQAVLLCDPAAIGNSYLSSITPRIQHNKAISKVN